MSLLTLLFSQDNPSNTIIVDEETRKLRYEAKTFFPPEVLAITQVTDADGLILAAIEWHDIRTC